jgi:hypothetical protein
LTIFKASPDIPDCVEDNEQEAMKLMDQDKVRGQVSSETKQGPGSWLARRPYLVGFTVAFLVMGIMVLRKRAATEFEWVFVLSAHNLLDGRGIYQLTVPPFRSYTYPPFMALMAIPFALMPRLVARVAWLLVTLGCFLFVWLGNWRLTGGGRLEGGPDRRHIDRREHVVALFGLLCALPYLESGVSHQQTDLLITALLTIGCLWLTRSRDVLAGVSIGLAAGMKCTPLLWAPYLAWKGRWKAAILVPVVAVGVNLLPDFVHKADGGGWLLGAWFDQFLRPFGRSDYLPGRWFAWILDNQSLSGSIGRWTTTRCAWESGGIAIVDLAHPWSAQIVRPLVVGIEGALLLLAWYALWRGRAGADRLPVESDPLREPTEFSVVLLLMLLLSPMSSRPHFAMLLLPAFCLARHAAFGGRRVLYVPLVISAATAILALPLWGRNMGRLTMWCGMLTWGTLALLAGCLYVLIAAGEGRAERARRGVEVSARFAEATAHGV